jgi:hypothetical protein
MLPPRNLPELNDLTAALNQAQSVFHPAQRGHAADQFLQRQTASRGHGDGTSRIVWLPSKYAACGVSMAVSMPQKSVHPWTPLRQIDSNILKTGLNHIPRSD